MKSSPPQQGAVAETWTADFLVLGQALYHWATLPQMQLGKAYQKYFIGGRTASHFDFDECNAASVKHERQTGGGLILNAYQFWNCQCISGGFASCNQRPMCEGQKGVFKAPAHDIILVHRASKFRSRPEETNNLRFAKKFAECCFDKFAQPRLDLPTAWLTAQASSNCATLNTTETIYCTVCNDKLIVMMSTQ